MGAAIHGSDALGHAAVTVCARPDDAYTLLTVDDAGPGVPPVQRQAVFGKDH